MEEVIKKCKAGVYLSVNENRDSYQSVGDRIKEINDLDFSHNGHHKNYEPEIDDKLASKLIEADSIYELQFYPLSPIGFYTVYGSSLSEVVEKALEILKDNYNK